MKHILHHKLGIKQWQIKREIELYRTSSSSKGNFHQYIINKFVTDIDEIIGAAEADEFQDKIQDLKLYREKSDYDDVAISSSESSEAYRIAKEIVKSLNEYYL